MENFESFNLHPKVMDGVRAMGYTKPTPIQEKAIPVIMQGSDIIGLAQTGTGKTAAFALPIIHRLIGGSKGKVRVLVISPTRELAEQTCHTFNDLAGQTGLKAVSIYGGVSMSMQIRNINRGVDVVVACPGRLLDHLWKGNINLSSLEVLVIDEADRMFDMGFLPDIRNITRCIMNPRQTMLFSATMPTDIKKLVNEVLIDPETVKIGMTAPAATVSHGLYPVDQQLKIPLLTELLYQTDSESVLIFTRTKHRAERVTTHLKKLGFKVSSLQGNLTQFRRQVALEGFRNGDYKILVATDIAARGIDVLSISHVINFDMPDTTDAYIHRIGRTGRVDRSGDAMTLVTRADNAAIVALERLLGRPIERKTLDNFDYSAAVEQRAPALTARPIGARSQPARHRLGTPAKNQGQAGSRPGWRPWYSKTPA
ncbi:DEAD/DEAH box helicase [Chloroflexota bacterium]